MEEIVIYYLGLGHQVTRSRSDLWLTVGVLT